MPDQPQRLWPGRGVGWRRGGRHGVVLTAGNGLKQTLATDRVSVTDLFRRVAGMLDCAHAPDPGGPSVTTGCVSWASSPLALPCNVRHGCRLARSSGTCISAEQVLRLRGCGESAPSPPCESFPRMAREKGAFFRV